MFDTEHISGAISMARLDPGTAAMEFFILLSNLINMNAQPNTLGGNQGYALFGRVIEVMDVIRAIFEQPHSATAGTGTMKGRILETPVNILTVRSDKQALLLPANILGIGSQLMCAVN